MSQQNINLGTTPTGSDGDTTRTALQKTQDNFTELYGVSPASAGLHNLLINALGQINQRGYVSGTPTTSANQYTIDRWKVLVSGQNISWTTTNGVATFTAPAGGFAQVVEAANIQGGNYVLTWTGTATVTVNGTAVESGTAFNLPANADAMVVFSNGTFSMPQLERGESPTRFDWRLNSLEQSLCHRYYQSRDGSFQFPFSGYTIEFFWFTTSMRVAPACSIINGGGQAGLSSITINSTTVDGCAVQFNLSGTGGYAIGMIIGADAEI